ncbi:hypothetical protein ACFYPC_34055 [Streptomyces sp. NPDC005808]|uniref:hypothetical protein n=1 Tax=Streptomyces sp. NPDC005808 TaxID=3364734 RepID=UPI00367EDAC5
MHFARTLKRTLPAVALGGVLALSLGTTPAAAASSGYVYSTNGGAKGWYYYGNGRVYANDIKVDGYAAVTQVFASDDRLLFSVKDTGANDGSSWTTPTLFGGTHKIRACLVKGTGAPTKCGSKHSWPV